MISVGLTVTIFSEKVFISTRCIHGFMSNLIKQSWKDSMMMIGCFHLLDPACYYAFFLRTSLASSQSTRFVKIGQNFGYCKLLVRLYIVIELG